jgi:hypothetical protein
MAPLLLHTTRSILNPKTLHDARSLHNAFVAEGLRPGIGIARSVTQATTCTQAISGFGRATLRPKRIRPHRRVPAGHHGRLQLSRGPDGPRVGAGIDAFGVSSS